MPGARGSTTKGHVTMRSGVGIRLALSALALAVSGSAFAAEDLFGPAATSAKAARADAAWQALFDDPATETIERVSANARNVARDNDAIALRIGGERLTAYRLDSYETASGSTVWSGLIEETSFKLRSFAPRYGGEVETPDDPMSR